MFCRLAAWQISSISGSLIWKLLSHINFKLYFLHVHAKGKKGTLQFYWVEANSEIQFFLFKNRFICLCGWVLYLDVSLHDKRASDPIPDGWEAQVFWELNSAPPEKQPVLLTTEQPLQPQFLLLTIKFTAVTYFKDHSNKLQGHFLYCPLLLKLGGKDDLQVKQSLNQNTFYYALLATIT